MTSAQPAEPEALTFPDVTRDVQALTVSDYRRSIIEPAMVHPKNSKARRLWVEAQANRDHRHPITGKAKRYATRTLYHWIAKLEMEQRCDALKPRLRMKTCARVMVSRDWDRACPLPDEVRRDIARQLEYHVQRLWRGNIDGSRKVASHATTWLSEECRKSGWEGASLKNCEVPRAFVERKELKAVRNLAVYENDAKLFHDTMSPRVTRTRESYWPGEILVVDVHPLDILVKAEDGTIRTPHFIAWLDVATGILRGDLKFPKKEANGKRTAVNRIDLVASSVETFLDCGIPKHIHEDNGSENGAEYWRDALLSIYALISRTRESDSFAGDVFEYMREDPFITSIPNSPTGKMIEGVFPALEGHLQSLPGYIGGDRMNKKRPAMGKETLPFPGTEMSFRAAFDAALKIYNNTPQRGHLKGRSPSEMRAYLQEVRAADPGRPFVPVHVTREDLVFSFAESREYKVNPHGIDIGDRVYFHDRMFEPGMPGRAVPVRVAAWNPAFIYAEFDRSGTWTLVNEFKPKRYADADGAKERQRRASLQKGHLRKLAPPGPKLDMIAETLRHADALPEVTPAEKGPTLEINAEATAAARRAEIETANPPRLPKCSPLEAVDQSTGQVRRLVPDVAKNWSAFQRPPAIANRTPENKP